MSALCSFCRALSSGKELKASFGVTLRLVRACLGMVLFAGLAGLDARAAAPVITSQPLNRNVLAGSSFAFGVTATGTAPLRYQWRFNGVSLPNATNATLALSSIETNSSGLYTVVVTNLEGAVTSQVARLTVRTSNDPSYPAPPSGWTYLYDGSGVAADLTAALDGTWNHEGDSWSGDGRGAGNGFVGGVSSSGGVMTIEDGVTSSAGGNFNNRRFYFTRDLGLDGAVTNANSLLDDGVTLTFRARLTPASDPLLEITNAPNGFVNNSDGKGMFGIRQAGGAGMLLGFSLARETEDVSTSGGFDFGQAGLHMNHLNGDVRTNNVDPGEAGTLNLLPLDPAAFHEFWITVQDNGADPGTHRVAVYVDGALTPTVFNVTAGTGVDGPSANYLALGLGSTAQRGAVDVDFFGYRAGAVAPQPFNQPVGIVALPASQFVAQGQFATFQVGVTGTPPYSFQWYRNGAPVSGASNAIYSFGPVGPADEGAAFSVVVGNEFNSVTSAPPAVLRLAGLPVITAQPLSQTVTNGDVVIVNVGVSSAVPPGFQWRRGGQAIAGATNSSLVLSPAMPADAGTYDVVVSNDSGSVTSLVAVLTVLSFDYGDAPDAGFLTLRSSDGARHRVVTGIHLGALVDVDLDGQPGLLGDGDDLLDADDEDGVSFLTAWVAGQPASIAVSASTAGVLSAWMDWNQDGSWSAASEQILTNVAVRAGANGFSISVPPTALGGSGFARFRFSTAGNLASSGPAADGEVEDYRINVQPRADLAVSLAASGNPVAAGVDFQWAVLVTNRGPSVAMSVALTNALPAGVAFTGVTSSQGACFQVANRVECDLGNVPATGFARVIISLRPAAAGNATLSSSAGSVVAELTPADNSAAIGISILNLPAFTLQPRDTTVTNGGLAILSAGASGSSPLGYQWYFDGTALAGQSNATLSIAGVTPAQQGSYFVRVSNPVGGVDSAPAFLTVLTRPSIVVPPLAVTNLAGSTAVLTVQAAGSEPLFYQWRVNGTPLPEQVSRELTIENVQVANAGSYSVIVSNAAGVVTSVAATLSVIEMDFGDAPTFYPTTLAQNGARHRIVNSIRLGPSVDFEAEPQGNFQASGDDLSGTDDEDGVTFNSPLRTGQNVSITVSTSGSGFLSAWLDFNRNGSWGDAGEQIVLNRSLTTGNHNLSFFVPVTAGIGTTFARFRFSTTSGLSFVGEAANGEVEDYAVTIEPVAELSIVQATQLNPVAVGSNQVYSFVVSNAGPVAATGVALADVLPTGVTFVSASASSGTCSHSAGNVVCSIGSLAVNRSATVTIQVLVNEAGLIQNSASLGGNQVDVVPGNNAVTLTANALLRPVILTQPGAVTVTNGAVANFFVGAVGSNLRYQWMRNGTNVFGATLATLSFSSVNPAFEGEYTVRITNEVGVVVSDPAVLTVLQPVTITLPPSSQVTLAGETVTLTVGAAGTGPFNYQWEFNGADLAGQIRETLVLSNVQTNQSGQYRVRVGNALGTVTSPTAIVTVHQAPTFIEQPQSQTNPTGGAAVFSTRVAGTEPLRFQWFLNGTTLLTGQTNSTLVLASLQTNRSGNYTLVVTNIGGAITSDVARLDVFDMDFGDAPGSLGFPTALVLNGARHRVIPGIRLGAQIDFETNGFASGTANGDDLSALDDEDGVIVPSAALVGQTAEFIVNASTTGFLDAWIDLNGNGSWSDPGEHVASSTPLVTGSNGVAVAIASGAIPGTRMARFRFSTAGGLSFDGFAPDGEVEDYTVSIQAAVDMKIGITDSPDPVSVASNLVYTLSVTNAGSATAGLVWVTNALPSGVSFVSASTSGGQGFCNNAGTIVYCLLDDMPPGATASMNITVRANSVGIITNRAWVFSISGLRDANPGDNTNTHNTVVIGAPRRFVNPSTITVADAAAGVPGKGNPYPSVITVSGITSALYKVTVAVSNVTHDFAKDFDILLVGPQGQHVMLMSDAGGSTLSGVSLLFDDNSPDPLPSSGVISSGTFRPSNYGLVADVFPAPAPAGPYGSTLGVFNDTDPNGPWSLYVVDGIVGGLGAIQGGWSLSISTADPIADLAVTATASSPTVALGSNLVYTVTLTNRGPATAGSVRLTNALPAGVSVIALNTTSGSCANLSGNVVCDFGTMTVGAGARISITAMPGIAGTITNRIDAVSSIRDMVPANSAIEVITVARATTDLVPAQVPTTNLVLLGQNFGYTLYVTNRGPNAATNVRLTDLLPPTASFVSAVSAQGACSNVGSVVMCEIPTLAAGARAEVFLTVTPTLVSVMTNVLSVESDQIDSAAGNDSVTNVLTANLAADLAVSVAPVPATAQVNAILAYDLVVTNRGPSSAQGVVLTNLLPAGFTFVSATSSIGSCEPAGGSVVCFLVVLDPEGAAQIAVRVRPTIAGPAVSRFTVSASSVDFVPGDNAVSSSVEIRQAPFISTQPQGRSVTIGSSVTLSATAGGYPAPAYQWSFNGNDIPGATSPTYFIASASEAVRGAYRVRAFNSEGSVTSAVATVNILVPPVISDVGNQQIAEDSSTALLPFVIGDVDTPAASLSVTASSSDLTLVPVSGIAIGGSLSNRTVRVTPSPNRFGTATITLRVVDPNGLSAMDTFLVTVNPVNDPPTLNVLTGLSIAEDSGLRTVSLSGISAGGVGEPAVLNVSARTGGAPILTNVSVVYASPGSTGQLRFEPATNAFGSATITVEVNDGGSSNNLFSRTFTVTVAPVNDPPVVSPVGDVVIDAGAVSAPIPFAVGDLESPATSLTVRVDSADAALFPAAGILIQGAGTNRSLTLAPAVGRPGAATITLTVTDPDGGSTVRSFVATVRSAGNPPVITVGPASQVVTNGARVTFGITAVGSLPILYQWKHNGTNLPGATNASLVIPVAGAASAGEYVALVSNGAGTATSPPAVLQVLVPPAISSITRLAGGFDIAFGTLHGLVYGVEYSDSLEPANWRVLRLVNGTGGTVVVRDTNAPTVRRFYRVRVLVAPTISFIRRAASGMEIGFSTFAELSYTLESSDELGSPAWTAVATVPGTGGVVMVTDGNVTATRRFYRVRVE